MRCAASPRRCEFACWLTTACATVQEPADRHAGRAAQRAVRGLEAFFVDALQRLEVVGQHPVELRPPRPVSGRAPGRAGRRSRPGDGSVARPSRTRALGRGDRPRLSIGRGPPRGLSGRRDALAGCAHTPPPAAQFFVPIATHLIATSLSAVLTGLATQISTVELPRFRYSGMYQPRSGVNWIVSTWSKATGNVTVPT